MNDWNNEPKQTVLVVDDTPENILLITSLLEEFYLVNIAKNGNQALRIAFSNEPLDIILLDITMPEMDGYEVCRHLKSDPKTMYIPVIFLTAKSEIEDELKGFELGAADFITKPISPPVLLARVQTHLQLRRMRDYLKDKNAFLEDEVNRRIDEILAAKRVINTREEALKDSEEKHRIVVENALESIFVLQDGLVKFVNPASVKLLGYSKENLISTPFTEFIHPEDLELVSKNYIKRLKGEDLPSVYPFKVIAKDRTVKWVEVHAVVVYWEGKPATLNFLSDITERKPIEKECLESI
jgi:PAS domain S-box-containing protein